MDAYNEILEMSEAQREDAGIEPGRVDTVAAGALPVVQLLEKIESGSVIISSASLKEGILAEFIENAF